MKKMNHLILHQQEKWQSPLRRSPIYSYLLLTSYSYLPPFLTLAPTSYLIDTHLLHHLFAPTSYLLLLLLLSTSYLRLATSYCLPPAFYLLPPISHHLPPNT